MRYSRYRKDEEREDEGLEVMIMRGDRGEG